MTEPELTSSRQEDEARKRVRVEEPEATTSVASSSVTVVKQSTATVVPSPTPAALPQTSQAAPSSVPITTVQGPPMAAPMTLSEQSQTPTEPQAADQPEAHAIGHGSLSVQAVPPPVVLPPDSTTHLPVAGVSVPVEAEEDDDDFEMPEINLESDTDEDEE